jgi:malonyl CoA-acyl carrier protein transacylase
MSVAFIFPGQGGQFVGQGQSWAQADPAIMDLFKNADRVSDRPISELCWSGPAEQLSRTVNLQPAVLTVSLAALRLMRGRGLKPAFVAGHSLGEFGALAAAEVLSEDKALELVAARAVLMDETAQKNPGAMLAVIGLSPEEVEGICELARNEGPVVPANFNSPDQIVISGAGRAVAAAAKYVKLKNGRGIPLPVTGAFHSELMAAAGEKFADFLEKTAFQKPVCPVLPNATGLPTEDPEEIKARLIRQIVSPVRWTRTVESLLAAGVTEFVEAWPKSYMGALVKKCIPKEQLSSISVSFQA